MHRTVAAALVAALALGVASCGGTEKTTLTRAELVRQIEIACRDGERESQKQMRARRGTNERTAFANAILINQRTVLDRLDGFEASGAAKADFESYKAAVQTRLDAIEKIASSSGADQQRAIAEVQPRVEAASRRAQTALARLGVRHECI